MECCRYCRWNFCGSVLVYGKFADAREEAGACVCKCLSELLCSTNLAASWIGCSEIASKALDKVGSWIDLQKPSQRPKKQAVCTRRVVVSVVALEMLRERRYREACLQQKEEQKKDRERQDRQLLMHLQLKGHAHNGSCLLHLGRLPSFLGVMSPSGTCPSAMPYAA